MALAIVLIVMVVGSVLFHLWSPWWFTELASNWGAMDDTIELTFWVTGIVFVLINVFIAYCVVRFRYRKDAKAVYEPENKTLESWLVGLTALGVLVMLAPGLSVYANFINVPENALTMEAIGQQWQWSFRFPGKDGKMGKVDNRHVSLANPFGLNPDDPDGQDDILIPEGEVHIPLDQPIKVLLRSKDVLHDFYVPQFRAKMDLVPGLVSYLWLTPTRTGRFEILCAELCGMGHFTMRGHVHVDEVADFQTWLDAQQTYAQTQAQAASDAEAGKPLYAVCSGCHGAQGEGNQALHAPKLAGQADWYLERQLNKFKQGIRGSHQDDIYGQQMAPMAGVLADDVAIRNVSAYIAALPDNPVPTTVQGDVERGKRLYATCSACHGPSGQGIWTASAPRQQGMSDWYLVTQLQNFNRGIRGTHPQDAQGAQMVSMAKMLSDQQKINDLVAYINTL